MKYVFCIIIIQLNFFLTNQYDESRFLHFDSHNSTLHCFNCEPEDLTRILTSNNNWKEIYIQHFNLQTLPNSKFLRCNQLTVLEISDSHVSYIEDYALTGLKNLKYLNLIRNNISELKSWSYEDMIALTSLDLRRNQIRNIDSKNFQRYLNLQKLNLAVNLIESIPDDAFRSLANHLKYLNLGKNLLKRITIKTFNGLIKLTTLALHNNQIEFIDEMAFETNTHLKSLRLEGNRISTLNFMHILSLARLVHFNISHNVVESVEQFSFAKDFELKDLDISYNLIGNISENTLSGLQSLEMLNASHNQIKEIHSKSLNELTSLLHLDFSTNYLQMFSPNSFNYTLQLEYLNLSYNNIEEFDSYTFRDLRSLKVLDISSNQCYKDNFLLNLQSSVKYLDLSENKYKTLNMSVLYDIDYVNLANNPWNCDWLLKELVKSPSGVHFGTNYSIETGQSISLDVPGIDCYNGKIWKSLIVINKLKSNGNEEAVSPTVITIQPNIVWPKVRLDRFDQQSVIIWLCFAVIIIFTTVRLGKRMLEKSEKKSEEIRRLREERLLARNNDYAEIVEVRRIPEREPTLNKEEHEPARNV